MSTEMKLNPEETAALDRLDAELKDLRAPRAGAGAVGAANVTDLCQKYRTIKGPLGILVKLLRKIPGVGPKAADAIEFLMSVADTLCPVA